MDYFAHHVGSPFMHFWYIGILLQFEIVFPLIFIVLKTLGNKIKKIIPVILTTSLSFTPLATLMIRRRIADCVTVSPFLISSRPTDTTLSAVAVEQEASDAE